MCRSVWLRRRGDESILPLSHSPPPRGRPSHKTQCKVCDPHDKSFIYTESSSQIKRETRQSCRLQTSQEGEDGGGAPHKKGNNSCYFSIFIASNSLQNFTGFVQELFFREREKKAVGVKGTSNGFRSVSHTGIPGGCTDLHKTSIRLPSRSLTW